jgi:hypothetical protein
MAVSASGVMMRTGNIFRLMSIFHWLANGEDNLLVGSVASYQSGSSWCYARIIRSRPLAPKGYDRSYEPSGWVFQYVVELSRLRQYLDCTIARENVLHV